MEGRLHRAGALGIELVQMVDRLIQLHAQFDRPAAAIDLGDLPGPKPRGQIGEEEARALGRMDPDEAEMHGVVGTAHPYIGINGSAIEHKDLFLEADVEVGPGEERWSDLATGNVVDLGLPIVFESDDQPHPLAIAGAQPRQAGVCEVSQQATPLPRRIELRRPAVMLPGRAEMVAAGCPTADGEDFRPLERRLVARARELVLQGITHAHRGGIDEVPVLEPPSMPVRSTCCARA
jgi:hypothetical protein